MALVFDFTFFLAACAGATLTLNRVRARRRQGSCFFMILLNELINEAFLKFFSFYKASIKLLLLITRDCRHSFERYLITPLQDLKIDALPIGLQAMMSGEYSSF